MKNVIAYRNSNAWNKSLLFLVAFTFMLVWLPFIRSLMDGSSYTWSMDYFGMRFFGEGLSPDFVFLTVQVLFYFSLMYSFFWIRNRMIFFILLGAWYLHVFGNLIYYLLTEEDVMFHGDTLGVHINLAWFIIPFSIIVLYLIYQVVNRDLSSSDGKISWGLRNKRALLVLSGLIPLQIILLASGEPHGTSDQIGVLLSIAQCLALPVIFFPKK